MLYHLGKLTFRFCWPIINLWLVLFAISLPFATGDIVIVKALGVGVAIAIFLDAPVVRALLVPALMRITGLWNWWMPQAAH